MSPRKKKVNEDHVAVQKAAQEAMSAYREQPGAKTGRQLIGAWLSCLDVGAQPPKQVSTFVRQFLSDIAEGMDAKEALGKPRRYTKYPYDSAVHDEAREFEIAREIIARMGPKELKKIYGDLGEEYHKSESTIRNIWEGVKPGRGRSGKLGLRDIILDNLRANQALRDLCDEELDDS